MIKQQTRVTETRVTHKAYKHRKSFMCGVSQKLKRKIFISQNVIVGIWVKQQPRSFF